MRDLTITAIIKVYQYDELNEADRALMQTAMEATARSYSPYSHFSVGAAALLGNGTVVTGTNQENAAYPSGLCAERTLKWLSRVCSVIFRNSGRSAKSSSDWRAGQWRPHTVWRGPDSEWRGTSNGGVPCGPRRA